MKPTLWKRVIVVSAILIAAFLIINQSGCGNSIPNYAPTSPGLEQNTPTKSNTPTATQLTKGAIRASDLPPEARTTLKLIKSGGPFPYTKDGAVFNNFEGLLPKKLEAYYHEYTVITPGAPDRGARRIIAGDNKEYYYTEDHYITFKLILE